MNDNDVRLSCCKRLERARNIIKRAIKVLVKLSWIIKIDFLIELKTR